MKRKIKWKNVMLLLSATLAVLTPLFSKLATIDRGYFAIGGEWLVFMFPLMAWLVIDMIESDRSEALIKQ